MRPYDTLLNETAMVPNLANTAHAAIPNAAHERRYRLLAGLALSLALHAALLFAYRHHLTRAPLADNTLDARPITVWLRPPPPSLEEPAPVARSIEPTRRAAAAPAKKRPRARAQAALPDRSPGHEAAPGILKEEPQPAPRLDLEAARRLARDMADDPDPTRAGTAVGQIPPKPYATETRLARAIAGAKRRDCKDGLPGGLLGPLIILMDKKDSGCKW